MRIRIPQFQIPNPFKVSLINYSYLYIIAVFMLPQYFGISIGGFALTAQRALMLVWLIIIFRSGKHRYQFITAAMTCPITPLVILYLFVIIYTSFMRNDIKSLISPVADYVMVLYIIMYIIRYIIRPELFFDYFRKMVWLIGCLGIAEGLVRQNPYRLLHTISYINGGGSWRGGAYRIGAMCSHPIGYGMYLLLLIAVVSYDIKSKKISIWKNKWLILLLAVNMFLTGSRSTLGIMFLELVVLFVLSGDMTGNIKTVSSCLKVGSVLFLFGIVFYDTSIVQYVCLQFAQVIDVIFETDYALQFGGSSSIINSDMYRAVLPSVFTQSHILSPWLGRGLNSGYEEYFYSEAYGRMVSVQSIDNCYINLYVCYAIPGLLTFVMLIITPMVHCLRRVRGKKGGFYRAMLGGFLCYMISLWYADHLNTFKPFFALIGVIYAVSGEKSDAI